MVMLSFGRITGSWPRPGLFPAVLIVALLTFSACGIFTIVGDAFIGGTVRDPKPVPSFTVPEKRLDVPTVQFLALGDVGTGRPGQRAVAAALGKIAAEDSVAFVLFLGDNFYPSGVESVNDEQWETKFQKVYSAPSLQIPFYVVLGNHDHLGNPDAQVEYTLAARRWTMPSRYYTFSRALDETTSVQFFCLDTTPLNKSRPTTSGDTLVLHSDEAMDQIAWLERMLSRSSARWKIVAGHHSMYSGGPPGDNDDMIRILEPLFLKYGVDLYLAGHDHHLEMKHPIRGVHYVISGGGATHRSVTWESNTLYAATNMGFNRFRMTAAEIVVEFYDIDAVLRFASTITK